MWFDKVVTLVGGLKNLVIIGLIAYFLFTFIGAKNQYMKFLEDKLQYEQTQMQERIKLEALLKDLAASNQRLMAQVEEQKAQAEKLRMDVGKEIRTLNRSIKELKNVTNPKESASRLGDAWDSSD